MEGNDKSFFFFFSIVVYDFSLNKYFSTCGFQEAGFD